MYTCYNSMLGMDVSYQVRRMVAVLLAVGKNEISMDDVRHLLENPDQPIVFSTNIYRVPSHGLYLAKVEYDDQGLHPSVSWIGK